MHKEIFAGMDVFARRVTFSQRHLCTKGHFCTRVKKKRINKNEKINWSINKKEKKNKLPTEGKDQE